MERTNLQTYINLLRHIKQRVAQGQQRAIYSANEEMLRMYWDIGEMLNRSGGTFDHLWFWHFIKDGRCMMEDVIIMRRIKTL